MPPVMLRVDLSVKIGEQRLRLGYSLITYGDTCHMDGRGFYWQPLRTKTVCHVDVLPVISAFLSANRSTRQKL
jgi:hypothetical protein